MNLQTISDQFFGDPGALAANIVSGMLGGIGLNDDLKDEKNKEWAIALASYWCATGTINTLVGVVDLLQKRNQKQLLRLLGGNRTPTFHEATILA